MEPPYTTAFIIIFAIWLYLMIPMPVLMIATGNKYTALETAYWSFQTVLTVGYGDIDLNTDALKIFATIYIPIGATAAFTVHLTFFELAYERHAAQQESNEPTNFRAAFVSFLIMITSVAAFSVYWGYRFRDLGEPGNVFVNGAYFTVTSISTVGYGDLTPVGPTDCIVFGVLVIIGTPAWFYFAGTTASFIAHKLAPHIRYEEEKMERLSNLKRRTSLTISGKSSLTRSKTSSLDLGGDFSLESLEASYATAGDTGDTSGQMSADGLPSQSEELREAGADVDSRPMSTLLKEAMDMAKAEVFEAVDANDRDGVTMAEVFEALDANDPKEALIELIRNPTFTV
jgi:hypothetical protein